MLTPPLGTDALPELVGIGACFVRLVLVAELVLLVVLDDIASGEFARLKVTGFNFESCLMDQEPLFMTYGVSGGVIDMSA